MPYVGDVKDIPKKWALCDGSNGTPDLTGRFLEGVTVEPKVFKEAGLPNITGWSEIGRVNSGASSRSLRITGNSRNPNDYPQGARGHVLSFNASWSSSIYKDDCTTVQPAAYTVYYIMKMEK